MQNFTFYSPTKIIFGKDTERNAGQEIVRFGGTRVLLHYGSKSAEKSGLLSRAEASLREAGLYYTKLGGVEPNPILSLVYEGVSLCKKEKIDFILAVGGGSVIDSAKAISIGAKNPDLDVWDDVIAGGKQISEVLPLGTILTIAASGSEMSNSVVITNDKTVVKRGYNNDIVRPRFSILNPELTYTLPTFQTACGCADIMMHSMERFFSVTEGNEVSDMLAVAVFNTVKKYARTAIDKPEDYQSHSEIMWAGSLSHNGITGLGAVNDWATHQMGHEISALFNSAHGAALTALWGSWARFVYKTRPERFAEFGSKVFNLPLTGDSDKDALKAISKTEEFFSSLGLPVGLTELAGKLSEDEVRNLAYRCTYQMKRTIGGFMKLGYDEIFEIYRVASAK
ncbi:MAG: iron-containing alcohol dehydrogenase [Bacillota bacterium]|nr:iron-containing alcohol dehydrogenase [Bacillota bacterium]